MAKIDKKYCGECKNTKSVTAFYASNSPLFPDGKVSICKPCIKENLKVTDVESVKRVLRMIDRPFIAEHWQLSLDSGKEPFGDYLRKISGLSQYSRLTYGESVGDEKIDDKNYKYNNDMITEDDIYDKPTIDVLRKWGTNFSNKEYYELESIWNEMDRANDISTPQHKKQLMNYCKVSIMIDRALEQNDIKTFQALNKEFGEIQKNSGFRPIDRKTGDESAGIRNFSTIFEEVERDGFIEPFPIEDHDDLVDRAIVSILNYTRKLMNMEQLIDLPDDVAFDLEGDE